MLMAYVDESGDPGNSTRSSRTYTLGCVLVKADSWPIAFNHFLDFRRNLRDSFHIRLKDEVKASYLLHDGGDLARLRLSFDQRREIYDRHMRLVPHLPARSFAIVVDKSRHSRESGAETIRRAWIYLAQRLSNACDQYGEASLMIIHDEGENCEIRRTLRKSRHFLTSGSGYRSGGYRLLPGLPLVDDPVPRQSHQSYFTQTADLVAYAGYRRAFPPGRSCVCTEATWFGMGNGIRWESDGTFGDGDGVVIG
jgi:Protein of unknown function (DUF3800)